MGTPNSQIIYNLIWGIIKGKLDVQTWREEYLVRGRDSGGAGREVAGAESTNGERDRDRDRETN